jgi:hypothetical protein
MADGTQEDIIEINPDGLSISTLCPRLELTLFLEAVAPL